MKWWMPALLALSLIGCGEDEETAKSCTPSALLTDDCGGNSICVPNEQDETTGTCRELQACGADGTCSIGSTGATCSEGVLERETPVCLPGMCKSGADCPGGFVCDSLSGTIGVCTEAGEVDSPCDDVSDCGSGMVCAPPYRTADFTVCLHAEAPGEGLCEGDLHCNQGEFCGFASGSCLHGTDQFCEAHEDCNLLNEECDLEGQACVTVPD